MALALTALNLYRRGVPELGRVFGLRPKENARSRAVALLFGLGGGLLAGGFALGYLEMLQAVPTLRPLYEAAQKMLAPPSDLAFVGLIVLAAPLIEEPLFRGLLYAGLARSLTPGAAVLASAAIFATIHPALSALPVFVLGLVTALVYRQCGRLSSAILTHMVYNAIILAHASLNR